MAAFRFIFAAAICVLWNAALAAAPADTQAGEASSPTAVVDTAPTSPGVQALPGLGKRYALLEIDGDLMSKHGTVVLKRGIDFAVRQKADLIVLYLNTPGGLLPVMFGMRDALIDSPIPVVSFVRQAYSAGALLALATDRIYMHPVAHIGDAIPIQMAPGSTPKELEGELKEKIMAPMRKEFATTARYKGHREDLAVAMVDINADLPELGAGKGKILVLDAPTAVREGLAVKVVESLNEVVAHEGLAGAEELRYRMSVADKLASFLSKPLALILLIGLIIGGVVLEVKTPGFGLGGIIAIVAVFFFFWANWYANLAHWLEIVLFLVGVGLVITELIVPGFGVFGISGAACILVSLFLAMFRFPPQGFEFSYDRIGNAVWILAIAMLVGALGMLLVAGSIRHTRVWQRIALGNEMESGKGFTSFSDLSTYVGRVGTALTDLRPVGTVRIDNERRDAMTEGDFVTKGREVKVIRVEGAQLVVEPTDEA